MELAECGIDLDYCLIGGPLDGRKYVCNSVRPTDPRSDEAQAQKWYSTKGATIGSTIDVRHDSSIHRYRITAISGEPWFAFVMVAEFVATIGSVEVRWG